MAKITRYFDYAVDTGAAVATADADCKVMRKMFADHEHNANSINRYNSKLR